MNGSKKDTIILGGGLSGLSSGYLLTKSGFNVSVYERDAAVGGLSKTVEKNGFRFDLGGHRFFTADAGVDSLVRELMGNELITVRRSSKIYLRGRFLDYPLKPVSALFGLGLLNTARALADYGWETARRTLRHREVVSLEDWVVGNFGRTLFNLYFKEYSEKVWGLDCGSISASWVAQRIKGLSLAKAVKNAFFKASGKGLATLTDSFLYPSLGIGRLSDRLKEEIEKGNEVFTDSGVASVNRTGFTVNGISIQEHGRMRMAAADEFISSIPVTKLIRILDPPPPATVLDAAEMLKFRDLVVVALIVDRPRVTDQTWIYIPEKKIPFGRIHEPTNWSPAMAPPGKSILVVEFFSFRGDEVWNMPDEMLTDISADHLARLGFINRSEVMDSVVVRVPKAYPLFEVGYQRHADILHDYLGRFRNLHIAGRGGMFRYYNMDVAIRSGMEAAEKVSRRCLSADAAWTDEPVLMRK